MVAVPKITIITPSIRRDGLAIVNRGIRRQTTEDFEWLVVSPEDYGYGTWVKDPGKNEGDYWSVYKAMNEAVRHAKGEIVVSWQDHTYAPPDTLEKFLDHYNREPKTIITGVGNKYSDESFMVKTWQDPRERNDQGSFYGCYPNDIELNLASFPTEAFYKVGGFDEDLDKYSSLCGLDVLMRLDMVGGYDFKIDQTIKSYSTEHGRLPGWDENTPFNGIWQKKLLEYADKPVLSYLDSNLKKRVE